MIFARISQILEWMTVTGKENECSNKMTLYKVCSKLCFLSKLVYKNNRNIIVKLVPKKYKELLFDGYLETSDEIVLYISDKLGSSANIRKSNIPYTLTLQLINLYYSGHTWYALPFSTCCLSPQRIHLIVG